MKISRHRQLLLAMVFLGGSCLCFAPPTPKCDLALGISAAPGIATANELITWHLNVTNQGNGTANSVILTNWLPATVGYFSATASQGTFTTNGGMVLYSLGTLTAGAKATAEVTVFSGATGTLTNRAWVDTSSTDTQPANNGATNSVAVVAAKFQTVGSMSTPRQYHTATRLPNGKVLITGGYTGSGLTASAELFDPVTGTFTPTGSMLTPRQHHTATLMNNGKVLIVGDSSYVECEQYDPVSGTFLPAGDMISTHMSPTAALLNDGRVLITGGYNIEASAEIYNPVAGTWAALPGMNYYHLNHTAVTLSDGRVLLAGGDYGSTNAEAFVPSLNAFYPAGSFVDSRVGASITRLTNNTVLLAGGNAGAMMFNAEIYNPTGQTSALSSTLAMPASDRTIALLSDGRALLCGGAALASEITATAEVFDPATGIFSATAPMNEARMAHTETLLADGRVLVTGGNNQTGILASAEIFDPAVAKTPPVIWVKDASATEGSLGTNAMTFQVQLSPAMGVPVTADFNVIAGSASADNDFLPGTGSILFPPGITNTTITVSYRGDLTYEPDETFGVVPTNQTSGVQVHGGVGRLLNDDPVPMISVLPASVVEGDLLTTQITFTVALSNPSWQAVQVSYFTTNGTAIAGSDFQPVSGTLGFSPGETNQTVTATVNSDIAVEADETLPLVLTTPVNAVLGTNSPGLILNDDGLPGRLHHFEISSVASPQYHQTPLPLAVQARDLANGSVTNFNGPVMLRMLAGGLPDYLFDMELDAPTNWIPSTTNFPYFPSSFGFTTYDVGGQGVVSRVLQMYPFGWPNYGVKREVFLTGGVTYGVRFDAAQENRNYDLFFDYILMVGTNVLTRVPMSSFGLPNNIVDRRSVSGVFTAPSNGTYVVSLLLSAPYPAGNSFVYVDNVRIEPADIQPASVIFTNGTWAGMVKLGGQGTNLMLQARDDAGHSGQSNPFELLSATDLAVTTISSNTPVAFSDIVLQTIVTNVGSFAATGVMVTNVLPSGWKLISAGATAGVCTNFGDVVVCALPALAAHGQCIITVRARTAGEGAVTNQARVAGNEIDYSPANNIAATAFVVLPPNLFIGGTSVTEQPGGTNALFTLWLSSSNDVPVTVDYATVNGTALANADFALASGTVTFPPGVTNQTIAVAVLDDSLDESNETFTVQLANPSHALIATAIATATIVDDDLPPLVSVADTSVLEGDIGHTASGFALMLSTPSGKPVSLNYVTGNGTAVAGSDYVATNGTLTIPPGEIDGVILVHVIGNTISEPDETFFLRLTNVVNATAVNTQAVCTILNDDTVAGRFDHFVFDPIPSLRAAKAPFNLTIRSVDYLGNPSTNFPDTAQLTATNSPNPGLAVVSPSALSNFINGVWTGAVVLSNAVTNVTLRVQDSAEHLGVSGPFNVVAVYPVTVALPTGANEGDGPFTVSGSVNLSATNEADAWFALSVSNPDWLAVPANVMVPAGQTNVLFDMKFWDDTLLNGTRTASVTATPITAGYGTNTATMKVYDNEFAVLGVTLPASAAEKSSPLSGTVTLNAPPDTNIVITLTSSDTTELTVPASVTLPAGQTSVGFTANAVDDTLLDGTQFATVTAHVQNWQDGMATVAVTDNETNKFTINFFFQGPFTEGMGTLSNALRVTVGGVLVSNLIVNLGSSDTTELIVPDTVTISNGQNTALFNLTIVDDTETDGTQPVTVTASLPDFTSGSLTFNVADNDVHHFTFSTFASVQTSGVPFNVTVTAKDLNNITLTGYSNTPVFVTLGSGGPLPVNLTGFTGNGIIRGSFSGTIAVLAPVPQTVTLQAADGFGHTGLSSPFQIGYPIWAGTPKLASVQILGPDVVLTFPTVASAQYFLELATNLPPAWQPAGTGVMGTGSTMTLTNPDGAGAGTRFFRLLVQPAP